MPAPGIGFHQFLSLFFINMHPVHTTLTCICAYICICVCIKCSTVKFCVRIFRVCGCVHLQLVSVCGFNFDIPVHTFVILIGQCFHMGTFRLRFLLCLAVTLLFPFISVSLLPSFLFLCSLFLVVFSLLQSISYILFIFFSFSLLLIFFPLLLSFFSTYFIFRYMAPSRRG